jgi:FtsP/CotA-like multicopper oxidase with cupredoxin domain
MRNNAVNDGANGVTECPTAPGKSKKYHFLAEQYGTSWYHSHFGSQYGNGVLGSIIIDGPASRNYDIDLGVLQIADWYYGAADRLAHKLGMTLSAPPPSDNIYFNGKAVGPDGKGGAYERMALTPRKRHRLRLVNPSVDNTFIVSLVGHKFTVISNDLVPVQPTEPVDHVYLSVGQRIDVTIDADQDVSSYWFNVTMDSSNLCGTTNAVKPAMIFDYKGANTKRLPRIAGEPPVTTVGCVDRIDYTPMVRRAAPVDEFEITDHNDLDVMLATGTQTVKWNIHGQSINITWDEPTLEYVAKGMADFPPEYNVITNPAQHKWSYWLIQNFGAVPHPLHLHGHDFLILGRSTPPPNLFNMTVDEFNSTIAFRKDRDLAKLNFDNPTRRDVTQLPSWGWVVLAFVTDNPGAWLMHCHIAWHISQGLGVQFLERVDDIPSAVTLGELQPTCRDWEAYWDAVKPDKYDSGL